NSYSHRSCCNNMGCSCCNYDCGNNHQHTPYSSRCCNHARNFLHKVSTRENARMSTMENTRDHKNNNADDHTRMDCCIRKKEPTSYIQGKYSLPMMKGCNRT